MALTSDGFINKDPDGNTRGSNGTWDLGAYGYASGATATPTPAPTATPTPAPTATPTPAPTATATPTPTPTTDLTFQAATDWESPPSGPFSTANGILSQVMDTDLPESGRASYSFYIANPGNYIITTRVSAPSQVTNSFFVNIDAEPTDPTMIWDVLPTTAGVETRTVGWRGNGTPSSPQFQNKVFSLSKGWHTLIIRGREAYTGLVEITIAPTATPTPAPTATPTPAPTPTTDLTFQAATDWESPPSGPFSTANGILSQLIETDLPESGRASYSFYIDNPGNYIVTTRVNAPSEGTNSFFVNIDAEPTDPTMIWDVLPITAAVETRTVGWRGNGTFSSPQFPTKVFTLSKGWHTLIIRGREANTRLSVITIAPLTN